jgi:hypothetical protein
VHQFHLPMIVFAMESLVRLVGIIKISFTAFVCSERPDVDGMLCGAVS